MKPFINILILTCTLFVGWPSSLAQLPCKALPLPQEQVTLHLDRNVCLAGETIWFKAWCFVDGQLGRELSRVLYVELFDEEGTAIVQNKYLLRGHKAAGAIQVPVDAPTRYYYLKAYTRYMRNFSPAHFHYQQLTIVNPLIENATIPAGSATADEAPANGPLPSIGVPREGHALQVLLNQEKYRPRQEIRLGISGNRPLSAELSVSVRMEGLGHQPHPDVLRQNPWLQTACQQDPFCRARHSLEGRPPSSGPKKAGDLQWLPETRGLTVSGFIQNEEGKKVVGAKAIVAVVQDAPMLHMGATDEQGVFHISLQHMQHQKVLFAGTPDEKHRVFIRNDFDADLPVISSVPVQFDSTLHRLLAALNLHQQLDRAYPEPETRPAFKPHPLYVPATNLLAPDRRIVLADFIKVPTMEEVFTEISAGVALRKNGEKTGLSVFNDVQQQWYESPLVLLDYVPVFDIEELLKINPEKVEAIAVYDSDYILGDYTIEGIVSVITTTKDFAGYQWGGQVAFTNYTAFATPLPFEQVVGQKKNHYPDFRPVLYWQPSLQLDRTQGSQEITVLAPDRPGRYEVSVQGFTRLGAPCSGYATFEVLPSR